MADEDRIVEPEETSEAVNMASEATPPPEASEATPPPETEVEARDDLSTPTQDETAQLISSLAPGVSASGIEAATSALRGIPMPTSTNNSTDKTPPPQASGIDEISDSEFAEDDLANEALRPVEKSLDIPAMENSADQRSRSRLSNVSSSDADLGATGKKDKNGDDSDAVSLSGLSSGVFWRDFCVIKIPKYGAFESDSNYWNYDKYFNKFKFNVDEIGQNINIERILE